MNEEKDNKDKESPESGQACFPTEIVEVDGFIADMLERYGADVRDSCLRVIPCFAMEWPICSVPR